MHSKKLLQKGTFLFKQLLQQLLKKRLGITFDLVTSPIR